MRAEGGLTPGAAAGQAAAATPFEQHDRARWPRLRARVVAAVFVGGCVGGLGRYLVDQAWPAGAHAFPWATFTINTTGSFLLGLLLVLVTEMLPPTTYVRPLLGTGFCGAWTTFSAVTAGTDQLVAHGHAAMGVVVVLASVLAGLAAASCGLVAGRSVAAHRRRRQPGVA
ncbi:MAG: crcB3 [Frankiales bacterium]|nr:crcB3 [Frankiales bacterium]